MAKEVSMIVSWNGRLVEGGTVELPVSDPLFLRGEGVFETLRFENGRACLWERHLERLQSSVEVMGWALPASQDLARQVAKVVEANELLEARVRITVGQEILIIAETLPEEGKRVRVETCSFAVNERSPLAGIKGTSYAENTWILNQSDADEVIRSNTKGELCEGCISNLFFVHGGKIKTPSLETGCLPGVMRAEVLSRIDVEEGTWPVEILEEVEEIWLSNAIRRLRHVSILDGREMSEPSSRFNEILDQLRVCERKV